MAFSPIELTTISRAQDYSAIKHNEDNRGIVQQTNLGVQMQKTTQQRLQEVHKSDDVEWHQQRPDAKEKGKGQYAGDGGRRRKQAQAKEQMVVKSQGGFDMKI